VCVRLESTVSIRQKQQTATGLEKDATEDNISDTDATESYPKDRLKSLLDKISRINADDHDHDLWSRVCIWIIGGG
jgi:hypothetical protein